MRVGGLAHRFLLLVAFVVIIAASFAAAYEGFLGDRIGLLSQNVATGLIGLYEQYAEIFDRLGRVVGATVTAVVGVLTLYKAWYYAEMNLPRRLARFVSARIARHAELRARFLDSAGTDRLDEVVAPPPPKHWAHKLNWLNPFAPQELALQFTANGLNFDASIDALQQTISDYQFRKASHHIAKGVMLSRRSTSQVPDDESSRSALASFKTAFEAKEDDLDALELVAKQTLKLHGTPKEIERYLKLLESAAKKQGEDVRAARALRYQAELALEQGTQVSFDGARTLLTKGIDLINGKTDLDGRSRLKELGWLYERRCEVQIKRERFSGAGSDLNDAEKRYEKLSGDDRRLGLERVQSLRALLNKVKGDKESPGD